MEVDSLPPPSTSTTSSTSKSISKAAGSAATTITINPPRKNTIDLYLISDEDAHYEQEILRDPYSSIKPWLRYIEYKLKTGSIQEQVFVYERACKALPRSYKIWKMVNRVFKFFPFFFPFFPFCLFFFFPN